jgi:hypothetical protein
MTDIASHSPQEDLERIIEGAHKEYKDSSAVPEKYRKHLKSRLLFLWAAESIEPTRKNQRSIRQANWRNNKAHEAYSKVQDTSQHLLCVFISAISPTACYGPNFPKDLQRFLQTFDKNKFKLDLDTKEEKFFDSVAIEGRFKKDPRYINFLSGLFPKSCTISFWLLSGLIEMQDIIPSRGNKKTQI